MYMYTINTYNSDIYFKQTGTGLDSITKPGVHHMWNLNGTGGYSEVIYNLRTGMETGSLFTHMPPSPFARLLACLPPAC